MGNNFPLVPNIERKASTLTHRASTHNKGPQRIFYRWGPLCVLSGVVCRGCFSLVLCWYLVFIVLFLGVVLLLVFLRPHGFQTTLGNPFLCVGFWMLLRACRLHWVTSELQGQGDICHRFNRKYKWGLGFSLERGFGQLLTQEHRASTHKKGPQRILLPLRPFCVLSGLSVKGFLFLGVRCNFCNLLPTFISWAKLQLLKTFFVADSVNTFPRACRLHRVTSKATAKGFLFQYKVMKNIGIQDYSMCRYALHWRRFLLAFRCTYIQRNSAIFLVK